MNEIVLTDKQYNTIGQFHNSTAGQAGIDRTVKRMHKAGISWCLRELVRAYIRMCPVCQKMSYLKVPIIARRFTTTAAGSMEVLNMDYEGPFPEDEYGNTYVLLTIIDTFSRAVGLYAVPNLEARHAARMLVRHIGIFGCPSQIVSDCGTHFTADIIRELMVLVGTNHVLTFLAASKQENVAIENANKRSQEYLRSRLFDNRILKRWSDVLPLVQRIMMAEPNEVTQWQLLFGLDSARPWNLSS